MSRAVRFERSGEPADVLSVDEVRAPGPGPGEVLVAMQASVVQPADSMFIRGQYRIRPAFPQVAGLEGTGIVVEGSDSQIPIGTRVAFRHPGAWADLVAVPASRCFPVPEGIPIEIAAQFALNPLTAWALVDEASVHAEDWVGITAARSAIARIAAAIAQHRGVRVLGFARPLVGEPLPYPVVDPLEGTTVDAVHARTDGAQLGGVLDSVGGAVLAATLPAMRVGATIVSYGVLDDAPIPVRNSDLIYRNLTWKGFGIDHWLAANAFRGEAIAAELWALLSDHTIELPVAAVYDLDAIGPAVRAAALTPPGSKIIIRISTSS